MDAEGEFIDVGTLAAKIEDADFGVGHTTVEAGFRVWLSINSWSAKSASHKCYGRGVNGAHKWPQMGNCMCCAEELTLFLQ